MSFLSDLWTKRNNHIHIDVPFWWDSVAETDTGSLGIDFADYSQSLQGLKKTCCKNDNGLQTNYYSSNGLYQGAFRDNSQLPLSNNKNGQMYVYTIHHSALSIPIEFNVLIFVLRWSAMPNCKQIGEKTHGWSTVMDIVYTLHQNTPCNQKRNYWLCWFSYETNSSGLPLFDRWNFTRVPESPQHISEQSLFDRQEEKHCSGIMWGQKWQKMSVWIRN